jgi:hypothetical protein
MCAGLYWDAAGEVDPGLGGLSDLARNNRSQRQATGTGLHWARWQRGDARRVRPAHVTGQSFVAVRLPDMESIAAPHTMFANSCYPTLAAQM